MTESIIASKSKVFALDVINIYKYLVETENEYILSKQFLRSGTSIGANAREGARAQSKADFVSKMNIALKEADETLYWLELLYESKYLPEGYFLEANEKCTELIKILTSIIKTSNNS